ncbi:MAG TPA: 2TM domain-containing protein [Solirubrobacterales bacterium]|nr:2TM domain-containing protein [Solirubrobacterales bacterium]
MEENEQTRDERERALERLEEKRDLQTHLTAYTVVNVALWALWAVFGSGYPWPAWITGLWAIGLVLNAWDVYFRGSIKEADIQREIKRQRSSVYSGDA